MDAALAILGITGPIYLAMALGYASTRRGLFEKSDMRSYGKFVIELALPALLFNALSQRSVGEILNIPYLAAYALGSLLTLALGMLWARRVRGHQPKFSAIMAMGMACPNSGFVGYPIMLLTFGPVAGVALALNMVVENLLIIPILLALADSDADGSVHWLERVRQTLLGLLRNPLIWGIVGGFAFSLSGLQMPPPLARTVSLFAQASGALSLFVIGGSLVGLKARGMIGTVSQIAVGKLLVHPLCMLLVLLWLVPIGDPSLRAMALLTGAMPMMGIYTILAQRHGHEAISAAALLVTTVASFFTLSTLLWILQHHPL